MVIASTFKNKGSIRKSLNSDPQPRIDDIAIFHPPQMHNPPVVLADIQKPVALQIKINKTRTCVQRQLNLFHNLSVGFLCLTNFGDSRKNASDEVAPDGSKILAPSAQYANFIYHVFSPPFVLSARSSADPRVISLRPLVLLPFFPFNFATRVQSQKGSRRASRISG